MQEAQSKLYSIYGARYNKDKSRVNITLVAGSDDNKEYATISLKLGEKALIKDEFAYVKIKMLNEVKDPIEQNEIPF